jgi:hypothetical protein
MALTDTFVKQVKPGAKPIGDKYSDGAGMFLLVKPSGKYWRMDYTYAEKRKTLALGVQQAIAADRFVGLLVECSIVSVKAREQNQCV